KNLGSLRHQFLQVHLTNVYDNLPDEELVRRDGKFFSVEVRAYVPPGDARRIGAKYGIAPNQVGEKALAMLEEGFDGLGGTERGVNFWREVWAAVRLEERLTQLEEAPALGQTDGLRVPRLEEVLESVEDAPADFRFHLSSGALQSFVRTLPLLRPRGYLQVF